ncbi:MAG: hypothetical protein IJ399_01170 [Bacilli bacterium]|nr:hypothetical protein [Bacilli bacterium]
MKEYYKIKCNGYKGLMYLFVEEKSFNFKKKKYVFFGEYIDVDEFLISEIKYKNNRTLVRVVEKTVDVIFNTKSINIKFKNNDDAKEFYDRIIELKKNDTFVNRSLHKIRNITEEDVRKGLKTIVKTVGIIGIVVHSVKSVITDGKGIFEEGKEAIKSILKK